MDMGTRAVSQDVCSPGGRSFCSRFVPIRPPLQRCRSEETMRRTIFQKNNFLAVALGSYVWVPYAGCWLGHPALCVIEQFSIHFTRANCRIYTICRVSLDDTDDVDRIYWLKRNTYNNCESSSLLDGAGDTRQSKTLVYKNNK